MNLSNNILLVDDHAMVRAGLRQLLENHHYAVREAATAEEAQSLTQTHEFNVIIMDLNMPGMGGLEGVRRLIQRRADHRILVISMHDDPIFMRRVQEAGALGYAPKSVPPAELLRALRAVHQGRAYFPQLDAHADTAPREGSPDINQLTAREFAIFRLLAEGKATADIADLLHISPKTAANHRLNILQKLGVDTTVELSRLAIRHKLIQA
jgi:two-component system invasion response regulator UvrY